jgi:hypothetical protein
MHVVVERRSEAEDAAGEVRPQFPFDVRRNGLLSDRPILEPAFQVFATILESGVLSGRRRSRSIRVELQAQAGRHGTRHR